MFNILSDIKVLYQRLLSSQYSLCIKQKQSDLKTGNICNKAGDVRPFQHFECYFQLLLLGQIGVSETKQLKTDLLINSGNTAKRCFV